jgi:antitoxin component of RelBE/YafQ-DinJ toxin-antitoxin module
VKTELIQFRTDEENKKEIDVMAQSYGLGISAYLRMLVKRDYQMYASAKLIPVVTVDAQPMPEIDAVA